MVCLGMAQNGTLPLRWRKLEDSMLLHQTMRSILGVSLQPSTAVGTVAHCTSLKWTYLTGSQCIPMLISLANA